MKGKWDLSRRDGNGEKRLVGREGVDDLTSGYLS
jgi:hypothetical protein